MKPSTLPGYDTAGTIPLAADQLGGPTIPGLRGLHEGIARIQCINPDCKADYFRPFSCKLFHLCPSQKRTLLFGEHINERLLLLLPHRQIVFPFPKVLRVFFRHDRRLYGELSKLIYRMIQSFSHAAAGTKIQSAAVIAYASAASSRDGIPISMGFSWKAASTGRDGSSMYHPST